MIFSCPSCAVKLTIRDDMAGRSVKCPKCQTVSEAPRLEMAQTEDRIRTAPAFVAPVPAPMPPPLPPELPVEEISRCPDCRATLKPGAQECLECGWSADRSGSRRDNGDQVTARPRRDRFEEDAVGRGRCYISFVRDHVDLEPEIVEIMEKLIKSEKLDLRIVHEDARPPEKLAPRDLVLTGKVVHHDHGNQFIRYFFTFIALIGPGSSKLEVKAFAETADGGEKRIDAKSRQAVGVFGGTNDGLMKLNVKNVANNIARGAVRHLTGYSFLNIQAYHCIYWALGLSLFGFIPFVGILFSLIGLGCGIPGLTVVVQRNLPHGKVMGFIALLLCFLGLVFNVVFIAAMSKH